MPLGPALFLLTAGLILRFAVTDRIDGVDLTTVGTILTAVGVLGILLALFDMGRRRDAVVVRDRRDVY
ncbi:hypothetical protein GKE82_21220 [Conexibacter sp. W3-3-2]|uniref:DUF6458 domain-containing protein n=1 Tax=Paraconexibacter algicola TaxID=2133960 RepID=A0A2T4UMG1_9ACTN|nr:MULTISPECIES: DUF6458 family protein [Solirubrobacterales]MTD46741.1 hypothetical protein [Conexibacter sp. W3-3-2]PTL60436.1 hypothetical protein C7Y72_12690 [Paraconexibacter algicola]